MSWRIVICIGALIVVPQLAMAQGICKNLAEADRLAQPFDDQVYHSSIRYSEGGRLVKTFRLRVTTKGMHKMLINFEAPGDVRGMRILILDPETMYTYLPQFHRVRRVAANARNQGFMGTNITNEDMSEHRYSKRWSCRPNKTTSSGWILDLSPRPGIETSYEKLRVTINKQRRQYERVEYYVRGRHMKTQTREDYRDMSGVQMANTVRYTSHDHDAEAEITFGEMRVNTGISDSAFSRRALLRGD